MQEVVQFALEYKYFSLVLLFLNGILLKLLETQVAGIFDKGIREAKAGRGEKKSAYRNYIESLKQSVKQLESAKANSGFYTDTKALLKKAGYKGEYAAAVYLLLKYIVPAVILILTLTITYPEYWKATTLAIYTSFIVSFTVRRKKNRIASKFRFASYKIYKYLYNQISSGVGISNAIRTVYEVVDDVELRDGLIRFAAVYGRTNNIDLALKELKSNFETEEVDTLCVALKQGIDSGDNQSILEKQEQVMFSRYFNQIQAETDACKNKSFMAVVFFVAIVIVMIAVPMMREASEAMTKIFIN